MASLAPRRVTALLLIAGFVAWSSPRSFAEGSSLSGRVLGPNGAEPKPGVVVTLVDRANDRTYTSRPTDAKGAFTVDTAPAGSYALLVDTPDGAFLASSEMHLAPGVNRPVSLSLRPGKQGAPPTPTPPPAGAPPKKGLPTWEKWVIAGGIVVGAAIVVDAVTSDDNEASQF